MNKTQKRSTGLSLDHNRFQRGGSTSTTITNHYGGFQFLFIERTSPNSGYHIRPRGQEAVFMADPTDEAGCLFTVHAHVHPIYPHINNMRLTA